MNIYVPLYTTQIWLCHTIMLLCAIKLPFRVRRLLGNPKHSRYLHVAILLACSFFPAVAVGCSFVPGDYITVFPPAYCVTESPRTTYYILIIPLSVVGAAGISCLVLIFWSLVRHRRARVSDGSPYCFVLRRFSCLPFLPPSSPPFPSLPPSLLPSFPPVTQQGEADGQTALQLTHMKAEVKVLVVLLCYILVWVVVITTYSVELRSYDELECELMDYFKCESLGGDCSRSDFENADLTTHFAAAHEIGLTLYSLVALIYVVNLTEIKEGLLTLSKNSGFRTKFSRQ